MKWEFVFFVILVSLVTLILAFKASYKRSSSKPSLAYIIRGPLFDNHRVPISRKGAKQGYKIDIRDLWSTHNKMIGVLSELYEVQVIFSTYDDTPYDVKVWASDHGELLISKKKNSTQFTTTLTALTSRKRFDYYFIVRSDIRFLPAMYSIVNIYPKNVTALNLEKTGHVNDIVHFLPHSKYDEFYRFIEDIVHEKKKAGHEKPRDMTIDVLTSHKVPWVRHKNRYYDLLGHMDNPFDFSGKKILFLGPADTKEARQVDTLAYDVVVITNNMVQLFDRPNNMLVVLANFYFSTHHFDRIVARNPNGVLCTSLGGAKVISEVNGAPLVKRLPRLPQDSVRGTPLGLTYFLNYVVQHPFASLDIVGVTFYSRGQSYMDGYGLLEMADHHDVESNKTYTRELMYLHSNITIDAEAEM